MRCSALLMTACWLGCSSNAGSNNGKYDGGPDDLSIPAGADLAGVDLAGADLSSKTFDDGGVVTGPDGDVRFDLAGPPPDLIDPCANGGCPTCGGDCLGGACVSGVCQPATVQPIQAAPYGVAVDDTYVYWTNYTGSMQNGTVWKQLKSGGNPIQIADMQWGPRTIALSSTGAAYFNNLYGGQVMTIAAGATSATQVIGVPSQMKEMSIDASYAYWLENGNNSVRRVILSGGTAQLVAGPTNQSPGQVVSDGTTAFWTNVGQGNVSATAAAGGGAGPVNLIASPAPSAFALTLDATNVYFSSGDFLYKAAKTSTGASTKLHTTALPGTPTYLAVDGTYVYFTVYLAGVVGRVPIAGGVTNPEILATGQVNPEGIAVDAVAVYWAEEGVVGLNNGAVKRLKK